jgi:hypothetical protein
MLCFAIYNYFLKKISMQYWLLTVNYLFLELDKDSSATQQLSVADMGPNFDRLWSYQCPLTKGRNVSSLTWNKLNPVSIYC